MRKTDSGIHFHRGFRPACVAVLLPFLAITGCAVRPAPPCQKDGITYGTTVGIFRGQWNDHYERALSYMEGECYDFALDDLKQALMQNPSDRWWARAYGMHFIDYFPHREKGLVHYLTGDYASAVEELEISVAQEPSEKALFYLGKARWRLPEVKQAGTTPRLVVHTPAGAEQTGEIWTNRHSLRISGIAEDPQYISEITISGGPAFIESSGRRVAFDEEIHLDQGRHEIEICAKNIRNRATKRRLVIHVDRSGPTITIDRLVPGIRIQGRLQDESGIAFVRTAGRTLAFQNRKQAAFSFPLESKSGTIRLIAADGQDNTTRAEIGLPTPPTARTASFIAQNDGYATDALRPAFHYAPREDETRILISGWKEKEVCFDESIHIEGRITSRYRVEILTVNSRPVSLDSGKTVFFNASVLLKPGENPVDISVTDQSGRMTTKHLYITRKIPEIYHLKHRYGFFMHPFRNSKQGDKIGYFESLFAGSVLGRNRFQMHFQDDLKKILDERDILRKFRSFFPEKRRRPDAVLSGVIYETRNGVEIAARLFDRDTSELLAIKNVYDASKNASAWNFLADRLAEKFVREFPLVCGTATRCGRRRIVVDAGSGRLKMGWPLIVYREKKPAQAEAVLNGSNMTRRTDYTTIIGNAGIDELMGRQYGAALTGGCASEIRTGDGIISR